MRKISSSKVLATSVFSLAFVIIISVGMVSVADSNGEDGNSGEVYSETLDVFKNISFDVMIEDMDSVDDISSSFSEDVSKKDESWENSENQSDSFDKSEENFEDPTSEEPSLSSEESEESRDSSDNSSQNSDSASTEEPSQDNSEDMSSENEPSEPPSQDGYDNSSGNTDDSPSDVVELPSDVTVLKNGTKGFVYFLQDDPRYDKIPYGTDTIGSHGCGPVNMAMIISTYTGKVIYPEEAAKWSVDNNCWVKGSGSAHILMKKMATAYGVPVDTIPVSSWDQAMQALKDGKYLITRVGKGDFSAGPHFLTIRGITENGNLLLANSISYEDSTKEWSQSVVKKNITLSYFWVYG